MYICIGVGGYIRKECVCVHVSIALYEEAQFGPYLCIFGPCGSAVPACAMFTR